MTTPEAPTTPDHYLWTQRVRGLLVGLALGDAIGGARGALPTHDVIRAGVATQLAAFTTEGLIRADVRAHHKGISSVAGVVWHAYSRWAAMQGIDVDDLHDRWAPGATGPWPDGWLARVPVLRQRRGSAPATVSAVVGLMPGTVDSPVSRSAGPHALTRILPVAALGQCWDRESVVSEVEACAALTHGGTDAHWASSTGVLWAANCLAGQPLDEALLETMRMGFTYIGYARHMCSDRPDPEMLKEVLATVGPPGTAMSALAGAVYTTHSFPDPADAVHAIRFAAAGPHGTSVAAVTGALLGATHGVDVWPVELVSRLELAWVLDTLARDLVLQLTDNPAGGECQEPRDPAWWDRYPGW